ncbi:unnamed protein product [Owenia fusiformis]|uniref:Uncharacterized protein n=1 Tax=Owenia fusiformis TaxID=6347 RepID=A0A8J1UAJ0_OWEFU|nr:unnamed protein product [Owenia fusiformis]
MAEELTHDENLTPEHQLLGDLLKDAGSPSMCNLTSQTEGTSTYQSWSPFLTSTQTGQFDFGQGTEASAWANFQLPDESPLNLPGAQSSRLGSYEDYIASLSQADSNSEHGSESGNNFYGFYPSTIDGLASGMEASAANGRDLYAEAMQQYNCYNTQYDPFGSSAVLQDLTDATTKTHSSAAKPKTYSDVAKNAATKQPKIASGGGTKIPDGGSKAGTGAPPMMRPAAIPRHFIKQKKPRGFFFPKARHTSMSEDLPIPTVKPDSKYGLDSFDDFPVTGPAKERAKLTKTQSAEELPISRKGSTSSVSSSSGIEDIITPIVKPTTSPGEGNPQPVSRKSKQKESASKSKQQQQQPSKVFFDPRRMFPDQSTRGGSSNGKEEKHSIPNNQHSKAPEDGHMLNNGKLNSNLMKSNGNVKKNSQTYINNDLRNKTDNKKQTNTESRGSPYNDKPGTGMKTTHTTTGDVHNNNVPKPEAVKKKKKQKGHDYIGICCGKTREWSKWLIGEIWSLLWMVLQLLFTCVCLLFVVLKRACSTVVAFICSKFNTHFKWGKSNENYFDASGPGKYRGHRGLEENIVLPSTGDEAMKRLLACKGKDPYSILGVKLDATDDEIRKYYRKQAVLVHPDKNKQPGAEEAFKILGHAFELIGEPEKRRLYNSQEFEAAEAEAAMKEFADLLTKLQEKMQEASNLMRCDHCGGKHRRFPVDRPWYSARFCDRCNARHSAKEGDLWAESTMLGFYWHYYACMEGGVYDITEWASCQREGFKHLQANAHHVMYRIATNASRHHNQARSGLKKQGEELEDFINHLFHNSRPTEGATQQPPDAHGYPGNQQTTQPSWNSSSKNKKRGKKKRH